MERPLPMRGHAQGPSSPFARMTGADAPGASIETVPMFTSTQ
jgi:hypothetical protein